MKKVVALLMAAVLTVGMTVTAFAAPSPSANADIVTAAKDADGNAVDLSDIIVSDSGTLPEESSFFTSVGHPFPAVCIRTSTERPEALDKACFILSGIDEKGLLQSVDTAVEMNKAGDYGIPVPDYIEENVSSKVVKIIQSYTGVVNKMVWRKDV